MTDQFIMQLVKDAFYLVIIVCGPILIVSLIVGLLISIFQAATTISEQTLTFVPKLIAVFVTSVIILPFIISKVKDFTIEIFNIISQLK